MHNHRRLYLLLMVLTVLKKNKIVSRVKRFRTAKATKLFVKNLKRRMLSQFIEGVEKQMQERTESAKLNRIALNFSKDVLLIKSIKAWKVVAYRARVEKYLKAKFLAKFGTAFFENMREKFFEIRTERIKETRALNHYEDCLVEKAFVALQQSFLRGKSKHHNKQKALKANSQRLKSKALAILLNYSKERADRSRLYAQAQREHTALQVQQSLTKLVQVGMYWLTIKGRFGNQKSRTYLAMKYGYRWLTRVRVAKML